MTVPDSLYIGVLSVGGSFSLSVCVAFGIRNFTHIDKGLSEAYRVLRPVSVCVCVCVCVCVYIQQRKKCVYTFRHLYCHSDIYTQLACCVCVCVCMCREVVFSVLSSPKSRLHSSSRRTMHTHST